MTQISPLSEPSSVPTAVAPMAGAGMTVACASPPPAGSSRHASGEALPIAPADGSAAMFDRIARRYDTLNRLLSLGLDRGWRRQAVRALAPYPGARLLDLATGTGELALAILAAEPAARVVAVDPAPQMLAIARRKVERRALAARIELREGGAERLDFGDNAFDGVAIAFGIRNVAERGAALREMARVSRDGGRVVILELGAPGRGLLAPLVRWHIRVVVPWLGALLSGAREYRYLERSVAAFPSPDAFAALMRDSGLDVLEVRALAFGACRLFLGTPRAEVKR